MKPQFGNDLAAKFAHLTAFFGYYYDEAIFDYWDYMGANGEDLIDEFVDYMKQHMKPLYRQLRREFDDSDLRDGIALFLNDDPDDPCYKMLVGLCGWILDHPDPSIMKKQLTDLDNMLERVAEFISEEDIQPGDDDYWRTVEGFMEEHGEFMYDSYEEMVEAVEEIRAHVKGVPYVPGQSDAPKAVKPKPKTLLNEWVAEVKAGRKANMQSVNDFYVELLRDSLPYLQDAEKEWAEKVIADPTVYPGQIEIVKPSGLKSVVAIPDLCKAIETMFSASSGCKAFDKVKKDLGKIKNITSITSDGIDIEPDLPGLACSIPAIHRDSVPYLPLNCWTTYGGQRSAARAYLYHDGVNWRGFVPARGNYINAKTHKILSLNNEDDIAYLDEHNVFPECKAWIDGNKGDELGDMMIKSFETRIIPF